MALILSFCASVFTLKILSVCLPTFSCTSTTKFAYIHSVPEKMESQALIALTSGLRKFFKLSAEGRILSHNLFFVSMVSQISRTCFVTT